jgi:hypothetical protein
MSETKQNRLSINQQNSVIAVGITMNAILDQRQFKRCFGSLAADVAGTDWH